jgi:demethylmenaquinone methyltransferase/2-methoxy-6-polyprenyl-1,4-benzoquinol methylase
MLNVGKKKLEQNSYTHKIQWICGDAEALPIPEKSIDVYTIAFGLRNVTSITNALSEARRVLRPGGRFMCLEFSKPAVNLLKPFYDVYSFKVLPEIGHLVANDRNAYKYLAESIRQFPDQSKLQGQIENAGLEQVRYRNLSGGIACIHSAWRI